MDEIVLTEDQYNRAVHSPYSWQNLVQIHALSGSIGLIIGLSLSDRNLRSILDALRSLPHRVEAYALLQRSKLWGMERKDIEEIIKAMDPRDQAKKKARRKTPCITDKIISLVRKLESEELKREEATLAELGVHTVWYEDHAEVEQFLERILQHRPKRKFKSKPNPRNSRAAA